MEVMSDYEVNTGKVIIETIECLGYDPMSVPGKGNIFRNRIAR